MLLLHLRRLTLQQGQMKSLLVMLLPAELVQCI
jgi:hypothetical protein